MTPDFTDQGRQFDKDGNLADWWEGETLERYERRTECMVEQYNNYSIHNIPVNGLATQVTSQPATVTIKTTGWSFYVRIYIYFL